MLIKGLIGAVLMIASTSAASAQDEAEWVRIGFEWLVQTPPPPLVDQKRLKGQIELGCGSSHIRFGDTAVMRGFTPNGIWPPNVRDLASSAALVDAPNEAYHMLAKALDEPRLTREQRLVLQNQHILTALQFDDINSADQLLTRVGTPPDMPAQLLSDRLFWQVEVDRRGATAADWQSELMPLLDRAMESDPHSFQVRAWRVIAWLEAERWHRETCGSAISSLSDRLLDLSEAGACPLLIGHFSHFLDRHFGGRPVSAKSKERAEWRQFATALMAVIIDSPATTKRMMQHFDSPGNTRPCSGLMAAEIEKLEQIR